MNTPKAMHASVTPLLVILVAIKSKSGNNKDLMQ